jgi:hypothetical protein
MTTPIKVIEAAIFMAIIGLALALPWAIAAYTWPY